MRLEKGAAVIARRPDGVSDATVEAVGKTSEASEYLIRARGALYEFHQLMGHADLLLGDAAGTRWPQQGMPTKPTASSSTSSGETPSTVAGPSRSSRSSTISATDRSRPTFATSRLD